VTPSSHVGCCNESSSEVASCVRARCAGSVSASPWAHNLSFPSFLGAEVNASPLWNLAHVKMEPQESEEGNVSAHGVLGSDVFEEPMSGMSEAGLPQSPDDSDSSYGSHSTDSLMGSSPVFNQRCRKRMRKI
jgi:hypothetical protein